MTHHFRRGKEWFEGFHKNMDPRSTQGHQPQNSRHLAWEGCYNTRDLGGLPTLDHGETAWRQVIRSDVPGNLTPLGQQALLDYGVRTVIDLRATHEVDLYPSSFSTWSRHAGRLTYMNLPIEKYYPHVSALISKAKTLAEVYCLILDHYPDAVATILLAILDAQPGGVVIHCQSGKDRTGIIAALLLCLAEVPLNAIAEDYAESQGRLWPRYEKYTAEAGSKETEGLWAKPTASPETIHEMFTHIDNQYGGVLPYLRAAGMVELASRKLGNRLRTP